MPTFDLSFASGESSLQVRRFGIHEALGTIFSAQIWARSHDPSVDLEPLVGKAASLTVNPGYAHVEGNTRVYSGVVSVARQAKAEASARGLSTYHLVIVPTLWLLNHRIGNRIYQHLKIPDIVDKLLAEWKIAVAWRIDRARYPELEYKVQYDETDYAFLSRLLEEAGITIGFDDTDGRESRLVLSDQPQNAAPRAGGAVRYVDNPNLAAERELVTKLQYTEEVRPGAHVIRDYDFRRPSFALFGEAPKAKPPEDQLEQYHYQPGAFLVEPCQPGDTPAADDRGVARNEQKFGDDRASRALLAGRAGKQAVRFDTNVAGLRPGAVFKVSGYSRADVESTPLLVTSLTIQGAVGEEWTMTGEAVFTSTRYVPPQKTPRPQVYGVQSAVVVGPAGQEIHCDEFGRVRVQFPWDREGKNDETACCWIRVSYGWAGRGYGMIQIPRIGQEVLVNFIEGDPDRPVLTGRFYNQTQPVPYPLPEDKTISTYKSDSSMGHNGFNELKYDDLKGEELFYEQAEKNLRKLVKNDETITVGHDRTKTVGHDETDTTDNYRTEVTGRDRTEQTTRNRMTHIKVDRNKLIKLDENEETQGNHTALVVKDMDMVGKAHRREQIGEDSHVLVKGHRREKVDGTQSLTFLKDLFEKVGNDFAHHAGSEIHLSAVQTFVGDAPDITLKAGGNFVRIDGSGVTIKGSRVEINVSGEPRKGKGSKPVLPDGTKLPTIQEDQADDDASSSQASASSSRTDATSDA
jgi:type VI secretion system secreted protein VgrG